MSLNTWSSPALFMVRLTSVSLVVMRRAPGVMKSKLQLHVLWQGMCQARLSNTWSTYGQCRRHTQNFLAMHRHF
jgi:hypothetical protein